MKPLNECPNCNEFGYTVSVNAVWCNRCGRLLHGGTWMEPEVEKWNTFDVKPPKGSSINIAHYDTVLKRWKLSQFIYVVPASDDWDVTQFRNDRWKIIKLPEG